MSHDCAGLPGDVHVHHQCDVEPRHATARPNARRCALRCPVIPVPKPPVVARLALECQMSSRVKPNACGLCLCCRKAASACCRADRARLWLDRRERCGSAAWTAAGSGCRTCASVRTPLSTCLRPPHVSVHHMSLSTHVSVHHMSLSTHVSVHHTSLSTACVLFHHVAACLL